MGKSKELAELGSVVTQDGGNVGIGTAVPEQPLHVKGSNYNEQLVIERTDTSSKWGIAGAGNGAFQFYDINAGNATRMTIDTAGRVTMPYQPCFMAYNANGQHMPVGELKPNSVYVNTGGHYSTSTGRFTAPISGRYQFNFDGLYDPVGSTSNNHLSMRLNGGYIDGGEIVTHGAYHQVNKTMILSLSAGDYVSVFLDSPSGSQIHQRYGSFNGFLIG